MNDDIIYASPLNPRVEAVVVLEDYKLDLKFTNGEHRIFDAKPLLDVEVFESLANMQIFKAVTVAYGMVLWPDDIDYCPDTLYAESVPV